MLNSAAPGSIWEFFSVILVLLSVIAIPIGVVLGVQKFLEITRKWEAIDRKNSVSFAQAWESFHLANRSYPTTQEFITALTDRLVEEMNERRLLPTKHLALAFFSAAKGIYERESRPPRPMEPQQGENYDEYTRELQPAVAYAKGFNDKALIDALVASFVAYMQQLPRFTQAHFEAPARNVMHDERTAVIEMMMPFYKTPGMEAMGAYVKTAYHQGAIAVTGKQGKGKSEELIWPKEYEGDDPAGTYLPPELAELFDIKVPFGFSDETRFMHHHVMGDTGTGKTTVLSHLIRHDLQSLVDDRDSNVVIIDSTKRMVRAISRAQPFAPGQPLHGRLILVGPDDPVALNLFADKRNVDASVDIISYAIAGNLAGGDESIFQAGAARYITRAIIEHGGNLLDFERILGPKGHLHYQDAIARCPQNVRDYFARTFSGLREQSRQSLLEKIAFAREKDVLERMFTAPDCRLDLYERFAEGGYVVLIDTDKDALSSGGSTLLGRFFLAMLNRVSQQRSRDDERSLKPVWIYLDEAQNYIESDERFAELLVDARQRRMGLTVSHHDWRQIANPKVRLGLEGAGIRTETVSRGLAKVTFRRGRTYDIPYDDWQFRDAKPMSKEDFETVRKENAERYGINRRPPPPDIPIDRDAVTDF